MASNGNTPFESFDDDARLNLTEPPLFDTEAPLFIPPFISQFIPPFIQQLDLDAYNGFEPLDLDAYDGFEPLDLDAYDGFEPLDLDAYDGFEPLDLDAYDGFEPDHFLADNNGFQPDQAVEDVFGDNVLEEDDETMLFVSSMDDAAMLFSYTLPTDEDTLGNQESFSDVAPMYYHFLYGQDPISDVMDQVLDDQPVPLEFQDQELVDVQTHSLFDLSSQPASEAAGEKLEKLMYDQGLHGSNQQCSVCLDDMVAGDGVNRLPCSHMFHGACIMEWLKQRHTCPLCRFSLH